MPHPARALTPVDTAPAPAPAPAPASSPAPAPAPPLLDPNARSHNSNQSVVPHRPEQRPAPAPAAPAPVSAPNTTSTRPLPRVPAALAVQSQEKDSSVIDSRTAADLPQRLLHSRFPSLNRIRSRKKPQDTSYSSQRRSPTSSSIDDHSSSSAPDSPHSPVLSSNASSTTTTTATDPDGDKAVGSLSIDSQPSPSSSSHHRQKPSSVYSADSATDHLTPHSRPQDEKAPRTSTSSPAPTGSSDDWSQKPKSQPTRAVNMHQTSSRLLRMTDDDRPFTRDFKDLFSTLMVSLPLTPHRVRFSKIDHTFTTEEAITNLGSLKFSQSNRMPDPKDPSRIVTTTTTTTFSMAKEMARSVCNKFLEARFVETCEGKAAFDSKNAVWQLTPKGMRVLTRFCSRNGIHQRHVNEVLDSSRNMLHMVILERDMETDKLNHDRAMIEVIFRRFAGADPNVKASSAASDTDSLSEYSTGLVGVRVVKSAKPDLKDSPYVFNGKAAIDWLTDCCMVVDRRECHEIANLFMAHDLISQLREERNPNESAQNRRFQPVKTAHYSITERGMKLAGWTRSPSASINGDHFGKLSQTAANSRDSNNNRMMIILRDPALRLLFREFLQETHCEENLTFYVEVKMFLSEYAIAKRTNPPRLDLTRENLASAYSLYNAFLAPGSPCELNIDHNLRNALAGRMTRAVGEDSEMLASLDEVAVLFDQAQTSVFKLMASDSVPKFSRDPKYATTLRDRNLEHLLTTFSGTT
ncbi:hypothetical protein CAC42_7391 [Sphaceloma murrayae]|uniref:Developmental regulator flbA n=1 Tax=Sphaceloma murrayae TaxID=2082308 RepID=A0A2K1QWX1_9PEZI|nr:hypothetical protein CAC42_7391 [Sphaceloma murrayae]